MLLFITSKHTYIERLFMYLKKTILNIIIKKLFGMHRLLLLYHFNKEKPEIFFCGATGRVNFSSHDLPQTLFVLCEIFFYISRLIQIIQIYAFETN